MKAIETRYAGHLFRSRLEARWAAFFDLVEWPWTYEPFDAGGYIPDFVLHLHSPCVVEVKPYHSLKELAAESTRVMPYLQAAEWIGELLSVGVSPTVVKPKQQNDSAGLGCHDEIVWFDNKDSSYWSGAELPTESLNEAAVLATCPECKRITFFNDLMSYECRVCGVHTGDDICKFDFCTSNRWGRRTDGVINELWGQAHEATRWAP